jgi:hypothetical protein
MIDIIKGELYICINKMYKYATSKTYEVKHEDEEENIC